MTAGDNPHVQKDHSYKMSHYNDGTSNQPWADMRTVDGKGRRELIAYARIALIRDDNIFKSKSSIEEFSNFKKELDAYIEFKEAQETSFGISGTFSMEIEPRLALNTDLTNFSHTTKVGTTYEYSKTAPYYSIDRATTGGADLFGTPSGRQPATSIDVADYETSDVGTYSFGTSPILKIRAEYDKVSPYLLHPKDRLIFGYENIPEVIGQNIDQNNADRMVDRITSVKVTFFGSLVSGDKEYHQTLNQPLTSDGIHESLFGEPIVDQWDVDAINLLSGSMRDALMYGDIFSTTTAQRGRRGSIVDGDGGTTGSLNRNIQFFDKNVIYSDSKVPPAGTILRDLVPDIEGGTQTIDSTAYKGIELSNTTGHSTTRLLRVVDPFARPQLEKVRSPSPAASTMKDPVGGPILGSATPAFPFLMLQNASEPAGTEPFVLFGGSRDEVKGINSKHAPEVAIPPVQQAPVPMGNIGVNSLIPTLALQQSFNMNIVRALNSVIFGAPVPNYLTGMYDWPILPLGHLFIPQCRGFKYGFQNIYPTSPVYHFRRDSFGQLRDLIESPVEGVMDGLVDLADEDNGDLVADQNAETPPIKITFVSRGGTPHISPSDTNTQNLSKFATSSSPYFDGESRERPITFDGNGQPIAGDIPPDLTDRTTIEEAVEQIIDGPA